MWKAVYQIFKEKQSNSGYTLTEIMAATVILGILTAMAGPAKSWFENPLANGTNQTVGALNIIRMRAISTTSAYRIQPDPSAPSGKYLVEIAQTRGCQSSTALTADAVATDTELDVASTDGLVVGDSIQVGSDSTSNEIIATSGSTITLGAPLGTAQGANSDIELINNWANDSTLTEDDITLPEDIQVSGSPANWTLCFDSRGLANLYDATGVVNSNLTLTLTNSRSGASKQVTVLQGGSVQVN